MGTSNRIFQHSGWLFLLLLFLLFLVHFRPCLSLRHGHISGLTIPHTISLDSDHLSGLPGRHKRDVSPPESSSQSSPSSSASDSAPKLPKPIYPPSPSKTYRDALVNGKPNNGRRNELEKEDDGHNGTTVIFDRDYALNNSMITLVHLNDSHEQLTGKS